LLSTSESVLYGDSASFYAAGAHGRLLSSVVGGSCPAGSWTGNVYTTGAITDSCSVTFKSGTSQAIGTGDDHVTFTQPPPVLRGESAFFTVTKEAGYTFLPVGGTCPVGAWNGNVYQTGGLWDFEYISDNVFCEESESSQWLYEVVSREACADHCRASASCQYFAWYPEDQVCRMTPTCDWPSTPTGWDQLYRLTAQTCSVEFSTILTSTIAEVAASGANIGAFSPYATQVVLLGSTASIIPIPHTGKQVIHSVGGSCPAGSWSGDQYTTGTITESCSVTFSADDVEVTATGSGVTISPATVQGTVFEGATSFTVTALPGHTLSATVGGTCPAGSWSGDVYTTGTMTKSWFLGNATCNPNYALDVALVSNIDECWAQCKARPSCTYFALQPNSWCRMLNYCPTWTSSANSLYRMGDRTCTVQFNAP
jgi:hypothetical protein